jgi:hypothetical protein
MSAHDFEVHQEPDEVPSRTLVRVSVASVVVGAIGVVVAGWLLVFAVGAVRPSFADAAGPRPAASQLSGVEQTPIWNARRGEALMARQRHELESWGWIDRDAGIARIPIERAMNIVVERSP